MIRLNPFNRLVSAVVSRLWRFHRLRGRAFLIDRILPFVEAIPSYYGPLLRVRQGDFTNRSAIFGSYGDEVAAWVRTLEPDDIFLDIGANTGLFSLIADTCISRGRIFAFEPNPSLFDDLRFNIAINGAARIVPFNIALSGKTGTSSLSYSPQHTGAASLAHGDEGPTDPTESVEDIVITMAPADLNAVLEATTDRRVCIKIDVEGHELIVLNALRDAGLLARCAWAVVEIDKNHLKRFGATLDAIYELMASTGLRAQKGLGQSEHYDEVFVREPDVAA